MWNQEDARERESKKERTREIRKRWMPNLVIKTLGDRKKIEKN